MNRLATQTSPYLQQHAQNPVDWHPWDEQALALAREHDRPILLSIGYSACHWCHVMAHESFEDADVAAEMNRHFVNIKVDREERPDLDQIYQTAHAMLTQRSGGWPLTLFLMPDGTPFFGGTYFPKHGRHGLPGFLELLPRIAEAYREKRDEIAKQNTALIEALGRTVPAPGGARELKRAPLDGAVREFAQVFDDVHGGIGGAPKFPHPFELAFCLRRHALDGGELGLTITRLTLARMAEGGIHDHLGGGFCRYSVDAHWSIPHFEKMLYDNAALIALYADAWLTTRLPLFERAARGIAAWVMREMQSGRAGEGGYYSSLDADSEHEEGKFYVWTPPEVRDLLTPEEYAVVEPHYGLDGAPNFEGTAWHLRVVKPLEQVAQRLGVPLAQCEARLERALQALRRARAPDPPRARREDTHQLERDDGARHGARGARVRRAFVARLGAARGGFRARHPLPGRSPARHLQGRRGALERLPRRSRVPARRAARADAVGVPRGRPHLRPRAGRAAAREVRGSRAGGFFFVAHDHEKLIHRAKPGHDNATPSGNGVAALALARLGHLIGEPRYLDAAERALQLFYPAMERQASGFVSLATALDEHLAPPQTVVLRGDAGGIIEWQNALARTFRPDTLVIGLPAAVTGLPPALAKPAPAGAGVNAWVCRGVSCLPAITGLAELERTLTQAT